MNTSNTTVDLDGTFRRFAQPTGSNGALGIPLTQLRQALRSAGVRLMNEDVEEIDEAARPYAPISLSHFKHFYSQAIGRHLSDDEVQSAAAELAQTAASPRSNHPTNAAAAISKSQLQHLLCSAGDALTSEEWSAYLATLPAGSNANGPLRSTEMM